jgi:hypothetical protein
MVILEKAPTAAEPIALDRRSDPEVRRRMSAPAMRTFLNLAERWQLSVGERRALLGWPSESAYYNYRNGTVGTLSYDVLTRISLLIGMFKALHILYPDFADRWMRLPNSNRMFGGCPPIEWMTTEGGMDGLYRVRRLLDARRGGWN